MSARGFGSVLWAGAVAGAALGFYLVSLNVASERAELEDVETRIALAQRDIRLLQTEIGTRGRLAQLERWNVKFIRLSAPTADQFVDGGFQLASLVAPPRKPTLEAPVVLASAPAEQAIPQQPRLGGDAPQAQARSASDMVHVASYSVPQQSAQPRLRTVTPPSPRPQAVNPEMARPGAAVTTSAPRKPAATKAAKTAMADPLAPLPTGTPKATGSAPAAAAGGIRPKARTKDSDSD